MEKGKIYEVFYQDDTQGRHKTLIFNQEQFSLLCFYNTRNGKEVMIPVNRILRIESEDSINKLEKNAVNKINNPINNLPQLNRT